MTAMTNTNQSSSNQPLQKFLKDLEVAVENDGVLGITKATSSGQRFWKTAQIQICVIGMSGAGKSSFVNSIRGLRASSPGAAQSGVVQKTKEIKSYEDPNNTNIVYWDVPGVGTADYSENTYLKTIRADQYDFFICVLHSRFLEIDAWLLKQIFNLKKKVYLVRSKFDLDVTNNMIDNATSELDTMNEIRNDLNEKLNAHGLRVSKVFLINNRDTDQFEFPTLRFQLNTDFSDLQFECVSSLMSKAAMGVLKKKLDKLEKQKTWTAFKSAFANLIPIPLVGTIIDVKILMNETKKYMKEFGTDEISLKDIATQLNTSLDKLKTEINMKSSFIILSTSSFAGFIIGTGGMQIATDVTSLVLPVVGDLIASVAAWPTSFFLQRHLLHMCYGESVKILNRQMEYLKETKRRMAPDRQTGSDAAVRMAPTLAETTTDIQDSDAAVSIAATFAEQTTDIQGSDAAVRMAPTLAETTTDIQDSDAAVSIAATFAEQTTDSQESDSGADVWLRRLIKIIPAALVALAAITWMLIYQPMIR